jgi:hypothetical protein
MSAADSVTPRMRHLLEWQHVTRTGTRSTRRVVIAIYRTAAEPVYSDHAAVSQ